MLTDQVCPSPRLARNSEDAIGLFSINTLDNLFRIREFREVKLQKKNNEFESYRLTVDFTRPFILLMNKPTW